MRVYDNLDVSVGDSEYIKSMYECLPDKAKTMFFAILYKLSIEGNSKIIDFGKYWMEEYTQCNSPIEKIFMLAFTIIKIMRFDELPSDIFDVFTFPQLDIETNNHKYYVDFYIMLSFEDKEIGVVVECDGHEFHQKTKEQVTHDNEREYEIKKAGYDVLRFSGSQIFNNPFKCANDVFDYLLSKVGRDG